MLPSTSSSSSSSSSSSFSSSSFPCKLCRRQFASAEMLLRHERESDLHRSNLEEQQRAEIYGIGREGEKLSGTSISKNALSEEQILYISQMNECSCSVKTLYSSLSQYPSGSTELISLLSARTALLSAAMTLNSLLGDGPLVTKKYLPGRIMYFPRNFSRCYDLGMIIAVEEGNEGRETNLRFIWLRPRSRSEIATVEGISCESSCAKPLSIRSSVEQDMSIDCEVFVLLEMETIFRRGWVIALDDMTATVELDESGFPTVQVKIDIFSIFSPAIPENTLSSNSDSGSEYEDAYPPIIESSSSNYRVCPLMTEKYAMGDWERHTKGIGSKLLLKMGYKKGEGLGKSGEGILKAIEVQGKHVLCPTDSYEQNPATGASAEAGARKERRDRSHKKAKAPDTMFTFLNCSSMQTNSAIPNNSSEVATASSRITSKLLTGPDLVKRLDTIDARIVTLRATLVKCKEGITRNESKTGSASLLRQFRDNAAACEREIESLSKERRSLDRSSSSSSAGRVVLGKKRSVF